MHQNNALQDKQPDGNRLSNGVISMKEFQSEWKEVISMKRATSRTMVILSVALVCLCFYGTALGQGINGNAAGFEIDDNGALFSGDGALSGIAPGADWANANGVLNPDGTAAPGFIAALEVDFNWGHLGDGFDPSQFYAKHRSKDGRVILWAGSASLCLLSPPPWERWPPHNVLRANPWRMRNCA